MELGAIALLQVNPYGSSLSITARPRRRPGACQWSIMLLGLQSRHLCPEVAITRQPARASCLFGSIDLMTFTP
jgi:hypothetical protein